MHDVATAPSALAAVGCSSAMTSGLLSDGMHDRKMGVGLMLLDCWRCSLRRSREGGVALPLGARSICEFIGEIDVWAKGALCMVRSALKKFAPTPAPES